LHDFRVISWKRDSHHLFRNSNGSAYLSIGRNPRNGSGGTDIMASVKLEVESVEEDASDGGRIVCNVFCSPSAYPHLTSGALDDLQYHLTTVLHQTLSHPSLHPKNLSIIPRKKSWLLNLDLLVTADAGYIYDALFMAARAALWDTKVPRTRSVEYKSPKSLSSALGDMDDG
ncbi:ribosomal protein S5 domain 2-type protein, partial [Lentinula aff. detonsa]